MHNIELQQLIINLIQSKGAISFKDFMELSLYHPKLGYYTSNKTKLGANGDFTTAPEIGSLFAKCLANKINDLYLELELEQLNLLEIGAGTGKLAKDLIIALEALGLEVNKYYINEISPNLRELQKKTISECNPNFLNKIIWQDDIPNNFSGIIVANELLDALPVHCFKITEFNKDKFNIVEIGVGYDGLDLIFEEMPASNELKQKIEHIFADIKQENLGRSINNNSDYNKKNILINYHSEINLHIESFIKNIVDKVKKAGIIFIDYGFAQHEYYHATRNTGTLMCHYQHKSHTNPLINIGNQDITSHVDFSALIYSLEKNNATVDEYSSMANFLINNGLLESYEDSKNLLLENRENNKVAVGVAKDNINQKIAYSSNAEYINLNQEVNLLTSPAEMGELFKVVVAEITKNN